MTAALWFAIGLLVGGTLGALAWRSWPAAMTTTSAMADALNVAAPLLGLVMVLLAVVAV